MLHEYLRTEKINFSQNIPSIQLAATKLLCFWNIIEKVRAIAVWPDWLTLFFLSLFSSSVELSQV